MQAERHLTGNSPVQKKLLCFSVLVLPTVVRRQHAQSGENPVTVNIGREDLTAKRVKHDAGGRFQAHSGERAQKLYATIVAPAPEDIERKATEAIFDHR